MGSRRCWRRRVRWIGAGGAALVLVAVIVLWMLFQHIPVWYEPVYVSAADLQRVRDDLVGTFDAVSRQMNGERPFAMRITQQQLNEWLAAREQMWPPAQEWVPPGMENPVVRFEADRIILAGTVVYGSLRAVLSVSVALTVDGDGLSVRLFDFRGGSLPVPEALVREPLRRIDARRRDGRYAGDGMPAAEALLTGVRIPAEFTWPNGKRRFRIGAVRLERGAIILDVAPLPRRQTR